MANPAPAPSHRREYHGPRNVNGCLVDRSKNYGDFDPDFASPAEWAWMYRDCGLQVVPAHTAVKGGEWKFPLLNWTEFQNNLVSDALYDRWYGLNGEHAARQNMGIITGRCSGNVFVIDLDDQKGPEPQAWWHGLLEVHNNGIDPETVEQRTGGGGRQKLFRAPIDWIAPTNKTTIHIDIRGQGGFAMIPPSRHESGRDYAWLPGCAPWEAEIAAAPEWLLEAIELLVEEYGGKSSGQRIQTASGAKFDDFGNYTDDRERYMRDLVWAAVIGLRRECSIPPGVSERNAVWADYERKTRSRLPEDNRSNTERLEDEGRGPSLFANKWRRAIKKWDGKVAEEAARPKPGELPNHESQPDPRTGQPLPLVLTAEQFVAGFSPPAYLIDGILQRGYLYSLTARTGHGKTAIAMYIAQAIARVAETMHGREVKHGTVLILAGENPDDIRARFLVLADAYGFDPERIKIRFIAGIIDIIAQMAVIEAAAVEIGDLVLVIVDTAAAYFKGDETNSNSQQGAYARVLRRLTFLPGKPAVLVNCHPVKNATQDNLLPMGGSAFLNEVDGNLTLWADAEKQVSLHWLGKFRGPEFEPLAFELRIAESARVIDADGRLMPSVVAVPIAEATLEEGKRKLETDENRVLHILLANPSASFGHIAERAGFVIDGRPSKTRVHRIMATLVQYRFAVKHRSGKYRITEKGKEEIGV